MSLSPTWITEAQRRTLANDLADVAIGISMGAIARQAATSITHVSMARQGMPIPVAAFSRIADWVNQRRSDMTDMEQHPLLVAYREWLAREGNFDVVTRRVLHSLLTAYAGGDPLPLFQKFAHLEECGAYGLCKVFRDLLVTVGLNDEYLAWRNCNH